MRQHIFEQINWRIGVMNKECYAKGQCIKCGCETTALQMAAKSCEGDCYPPLLNKDRWRLFKAGLQIPAKQVGSQKKIRDDGYRHWEYGMHKAYLIQTVHISADYSVRKGDYVIPKTRKEIQYVQIN
jgi:hypothetical protein